MGNLIETFTTEETSTTEDSLRRKIENSQVVPAVTRAVIPNEPQYGADAAYSLIAYKNQNPDTMSDFDQARLNFENKYESFLNWYGQYSNVVIKDFKGVAITFPVDKYFVNENYPWLKATR